MLIFSVLVVGLADVAVAKKKKADGRALYVEFCKPCHTEGSDNGHYTPMTLIQDQWDRFFDEKYEATHSGVIVPRSRRPTGDGSDLRERPRSHQKIRDQGLQRTPNTR